MFKPIKITSSEFIESNGSTQKIYYTLATHPEFESLTRDTVYISINGTKYFFYKTKQIED